MIRTPSRRNQVVAAGIIPQDAPRQGPLWLARLQQEDNWWLQAERLEQQGRLADARSMYLVDADRQLVRGHHARVAVARAAAAELTIRLGDLDLARWERQVAAEHLILHAKQTAGSSLREAAWAYDKAARLYEAAGCPVESEEMRRCAAAVGLHLALPVGDLDLSVRSRDTQ